MEVKRKRDWNLGRSWAKAVKLGNTGVWLDVLCSSVLGTAVEPGVHSGVGYWVHAPNYRIPGVVSSPKNI